MLKKYSLSALVILFVFFAGVFAGCNKDISTPGTAAGKAEHGKISVPAALSGAHSVTANGTIEVAFSPNGGVTDMIVKNINAAKKSVQVQAYSFTSQEIISALINAKKRGVDVRIIADKSNAEDGDSKQNQKEKELLKSIVDSGIPLKIDADFQIAHSKIMIIDSVDVITGSFNFTNSAEHNNAENCLVLHGNKQLADLYSQNWQWRWEATTPYGK